jgi:hypothetical protein
MQRCDVNKVGRKIHLILRVFCGIMQAWGEMGVRETASQCLRNKAP